MTVGLWGCDMFPIMPPHPPPRMSPRDPRPSRTSALSPPSPPSPAASPLLGSSAGPHCYFRLDVATPPLTVRATSTPRPEPARSPRSPRHSPPLHAVVPVGVVAAEDIPLHAASRTFQPTELLAEQLAAESDAKHVAELRLRLFSDGYLDSDTEPTPRWVRRVRLADDCHSANVQLQVVRGSAACRVRAVRPLDRGTSLQLWFADDVLACLRLPFLAPHNIQGEKRYVCHRCDRTFEFPNPLKLHLSLDCGREDVAELWRRLQHHQGGASSAFKPYWGGSDSSVDSGVSGLGASLSGNLSGSLGLSLNGSLSSSLNGHASPRPGHSPSLFGAFHHWALRPSLRPVLSPALSPAHHLLPRPLPPPPEHIGILGHLGHGHGGDADVAACTPPHAHQASYHQHASDMETLVSNLGRSKQGHLCIYCGKVYSRKYGLKIHIRTHTGFKPLKCKYCLRPFGDPSNLNKHVRLHAEGDTPYKCDLCGKVLVRRRDLERHVKSRHQDGGDWDLDPEHDQDDVEVDVGDEVHDDDEDDEKGADAETNGGGALQCDSLRKRRAIPTV